MKEATNALMKTGLALVVVGLLTAACGRDDKKNNRSAGATDELGEDSNDATGTKKNQSGTTGGDTNQDQGTATPDDGTTADNLPPLSSITVPIGLRNYDQINATMSALTGVPTSNATVKAAFTNLTSGLPTDNDIKSFLGSQQVAIFKLAVEYCDALVKDTTARTAVFGNFNFAAAPSTALNDAGQMQVADALVTRFWGKDLSSLPVHADSVNMAVAAIKDVLVGKNLATVTVTPAVVTGACTAVLASAPIAIY